MPACPLPDLKDLRPPQFFIAHGTVRRNYIATPSRTATCVSHMESGRMDDEGARGPFRVIWSGRRAPSRATTTAASDKVKP